MGLGCFGGGEEFGSQFEVVLRVSGRRNALQVLAVKGFVNILRLIGIGAGGKV